MAVFFALMGMGILGAISPMFIENLRASGVKKKKKMVLLEMSW